METKEIVMIELLNGKHLISNVLEKRTDSWTLENPMDVRFVGENQLGFAPSLMTDPKQMVSTLQTTAIAMMYKPEEGISHAYEEYVKKLTSSIIQLDNTIKPVTLLNG